MDTKICKRCNGLGYLIEFNKDTETNEIVMCDCITDRCECKNYDNPDLDSGYYIKDNVVYTCFCHPYRSRIRSINRYLNNTDLNKKFKYKFLDDFKTKLNGKIIPHSTDVKGSIILLMKNIIAGNMPNGIVFYSDTKGNGKTLAAAILLNELIFQLGVPGKYVKLSSSYFRKLRKSYDVASDNYGMESDIIEQYVNTNIIVIDDFGTQKNTEWEQEKLYELIDGRYEKERITIITSNLNEFDNIKKLANSERIYSRLIEMCQIVKVTSPSYRLNFYKK